MHRGVPKYDTSNGARKLVHNVVDGVTYKWCGGESCLKEDTGMWKPFDHFNVCNSRWDKLETMCKDCKAFARSAATRKKKEEALEKEKEILKQELVGNEGKRKCKECEEYKDPGDFRKNKSLKDGLELRCRVCMSKDGSKTVGKPVRVEHTIQDGLEGKVCKTCKVWKSFEGNNYKAMSRKYKDGSTQYYPYCRICNNEKERERYANNKK